jgi:hypothetical protein
MSEWMKVMLDEIARKKSEASAAQAEIERRGREAANPSSEEASAQDAPDKAIRGKSPGGRPPP